MTSLSTHAALIAAVLRRHVKSEHFHLDTVCDECRQLWPCDAYQLAAALSRERARSRRWVERGFKLGYKEGLEEGLADARGCASGESLDDALRRCAADLDAIERELEEER